MPFTENGIVPSIIMNPHAIPSRMTIGQLMEALESKVCGMSGRKGDASPFNCRTVDDIASELESQGMERYGNEIMYNPRTGERVPCSIFVCPTYYQRLKHMVEDKVHCLTGDHDVLTRCGWKPICDLSVDDEIATLSPVDQRIEYARPTEIFWYPNYRGDLYRILDDGIDLQVSSDHRMYVSLDSVEWGLISVKELASMPSTTVVYYKQGGDWSPAPPGVELSSPGWRGPLTGEDKAWTSAALTAFTATEINGSGRLPDWVWQAPSLLACALLHHLTDKGGQIRTRVRSLADDLMRLALHAGGYALLDCVGEGEDIKFILSVRGGAATASKSKPEVIVSSSSCKPTPVFCVAVPNEVFYVRRNGRPVWTGNSRGANGPVVLLTRQPAEGRARDGGLRLGEMEMECLWAHGTMFFLKERFMECSDNYRVFICKECGMLAHVNPEKDIYHCKACKNITHFSELRIPYASKLLIQEIQTMSIGTRFITDK